MASSTGKPGKIRDKRTRSGVSRTNAQKASARRRRK